MNFKTLGKVAAICTTAFTFLTPPAAAGEYDYIGELLLTAAPTCPRGYFPAQGQILPISSYTSLYALIGNIYGGDGRITFALPDLRGRAPVHSGLFPGGVTHDHGTAYGSEEYFLTVEQLPSHSHTVNATNAPADRHGPGTDLLATATYQDGTKLNIYSDGLPNKQMNPAMIAPTGEGRPVPLAAPRLAMSWCINVEGIYPSSD